MPPIFWDLKELEFPSYLSVFIVTGAVNIYRVLLFSNVVLIDKVYNIKVMNYILNRWTEAFLHDGFLKKKICDIFWTCSKLVIH